MDNVVYILGAGFSVPAGIPSIANFIQRSKDLFAGDQKRYAHFSEIYQSMGELAKLKNYYSADLDNIEEVLSLIEARSIESARRFGEFIADVVSGYTPSEFPTSFSESWKKKLWVDDPAGYGGFIFSLFHCTVQCDGQRLHIPARAEAKANYSIVTLNYDTLLENLLDHIHRQTAVRLSFGDEVPLVKLHGCARDGAIIAPTWQKAVSQEVRHKWSSAAKLLGKANHIRVIGYSLPASDALFRNLLRSSGVDLFNLKRFDVICLDPGGDVRKRYEDLICHRGFRFKNVSTEDYLQGGPASPHGKLVSHAQDMDFSDMEIRHERYFA